MNRELSLTYAPAAAYHLGATLRMLALGGGDPCLRVDRPGSVRLVVRAPRGPLLVQLDRNGDEVGVRVAGDEPEWLEPFLPTLLGLDFQPPAVAEPRRLKSLAHRFAGFRLPRAPVLFPRLVQIVLQQLVSYEDACYGWRQLVRRYGETIPGYADLMAPPTAQVLSRLASYQFIECGILPQHGRRISGLARVAGRLEATWGGGVAAAAREHTCALLSQQRGVGPWTIGYLRGSALGDSDAVVLGDYGFPRQVAYFFTGQPQEATDDDMLRLLTPYRPHRFYVLALLLKSGLRPPRRGPRRARLRDRLRAHQREQ